MMGLIHIYCGDGKGKTTAALGLALRAAGSGMRVHIFQFLKGSDTSELETLKQIPEITLERCDRNYGFTFSMTAEDKKDITDNHNKMLNKAWELMNQKKIDMLVLDEFNAAYEYHLLNRELAQRVVLQKPEQTELILTGRNPLPIFIEAADYVSEIKAVKHPWQKGVSARKGIEY